MNGRKIQAILFDLGETLILFGRLRANEVFDQAARFSYDYLIEHSQPVRYLTGPPVFRTIISLSRISPSAATVFIGCGTTSTSGCGC